MNRNNCLYKEITHTDKLRIFCFPYVGGGASVFLEWGNLLPRDIGVYPIQYPGRENRIKEKPMQSIDELVNEIFNSIKNHLNDIPFIFLGHSVGTKIVYELTLKVQKELGVSPNVIIVSAGRAPHLKEINSIHHLIDDGFIYELRRFLSIPEEILKNREIMKFFLPMLRADFKIDETYARKGIKKIDVPILGFMETEDKEITLDELIQWKNVSTKTFSYNMIKGGHMFINTNKEQVISAILNYLEI